MAVRVWVGAVGTPSRGQGAAPYAGSLIAAYAQTGDYRQTLAYLGEYKRERGIDPDALAS